MRLYPQDLGSRWHVRFVMRRNASQSGAIAPVDAPPPQMGIMGRFFAWRSGMTHEQAAHALPASGSAIGFAWGVWAFSILLGILPAALARKQVMTPEAAWALAATLAAGAGWIGAATGRYVFRWLHKPLQPGEVAASLESATDPLDRAFMELIHDAVRLPASAQTEEQVRAAISSLANALERLPTVQAEEVDTSALREEAFQVLEQSRLEGDPVLAESLSRRSRALLQRAEATESAQTYARRTAGLRAELLAQTQALRAALHAFDPTSPQSSGLIPLAEAAFALNRQAVSLATARTELAEALTPKQIASASETVQVGRAG